MTKHDIEICQIFFSCIPFKRTCVEFIIFVVNNMSHDHDVINRQLLRHGPKSFTVTPKKMNEDIDLKHLAFVFLGKYRFFLLSLPPETIR